VFINLRDPVEIDQFVLLILIHNDIRQLHVVSNIHLTVCIYTWGLALGSAASLVEERLVFSN
jgi:hypothetical protein